MNKAHSSKLKAVILAVAIAMVVTMMVPLALAAPSVKAQPPQGTDQPAAMWIEDPTDGGSHFEVTSGDTFDVNVMIWVDPETEGSSFALTALNFKAEDQGSPLLECTGITVTGDPPGDYTSYFYGSAEELLSRRDGEICNEDERVEYSMVIRDHIQYGNQAGEGVFLTYHMGAKEGVSGVAPLELKEVGGNVGGVAVSWDVFDGEVKVTEAQGPPPPKPDLTITEVTQTWITELKYTVSYTVKNQGDDDAIEFEVGLDIKEPLVGFTSKGTDTISGGLAAGDSRSRSFSYEVVFSDFVIEDNNEVKVTADIQRVVDESSEGNNWLQKFLLGAPLISAELGGKGSWSIEEGSDPVNIHLIDIRSAGKGPFSWSVSSDVDWLSLEEPSSGNHSGSLDAIQPVAATIDPSGLAVGEYHANITITSEEAVNSPQTVPLTLQIVEPGSVVDDSSDDSAGGGISPAVIGGGIGGGIVLVLLVYFLAIRRRRAA